MSVKYITLFYGVSDLNSFPLYEHHLCLRVESIVLSLWFYVEALGTISTQFHPMVSPILYQ